LKVFSKLETNGFWFLKIFIKPGTNIYFNQKEKKKKNTKPKLDGSSKKTQESANTTRIEKANI
jgi:hypothetical protein